MFKKIGEVWVDTGTLVIGDPCYVPELMDAVKKSMEDVRELHRDFSGRGVLVSTGIGDNIYPVYASIRNNIVTSVTIDFLVPKEFLKKTK
jgi:hypothetical protein